MTTTREDGFIHRLVERESSPEDLRALAALAADDDRVWDRVSAALRADAALERAVGAALAPAERVELPRPRAALRRAWLLFGWAAAAALAPILLFGRSPGERVAPPGALAGEPVGELTRVLLDAKKARGGEGLEVLYVRRLVERAFVLSLLEVGLDEHGDPAVAPASVARFRPPESL